MNLVKNFLQKIFIIINYFLKRIVKIIIAWIIGFISSIIFSIYTGYMFDGFPAFICQPFIAMIESGFFVISALVIGLPLALPGVAFLWNKLKALYIILFCTGIILFLYYKQLGFITQIENSVGDLIIGPDPGVLIALNFIVVFSIIHWPSKKYD